MQDSLPDILLNKNKSDYLSFLYLFSCGRLPFKECSCANVEIVISKRRTRCGIPIVRPD